MYGCKILDDTVNPVGHRLTTFEVTFPRFILAELNTHRMLSRNSASSRAIPTERLIEGLKVNAFFPHFNERVTGMGVGKPLTTTEQAKAETHWASVLAEAMTAAKRLLHTDKSRANRLLEPFMWHTAIVTATEWDNFYALRDHKDAQPEFRRIAASMRLEQMVHTPRKLNWGEWHLPLWFIEDGDEYERYPAEVSAGRCARVSYDRQHDTEDPSASIRRWNRLSGSGHWSPGEHPARSVTEEEWEYVKEMQEAERRSADRHGLTPNTERHEFFGNFRGFVQLRKHYPEEAVFNQP